MRRLYALLALALAVVALTQWQPARLGAWKDALWGGTQVITGKETLDRGRMTAQLLFRRRLERALREYQTLQGTRPKSLQDLVEAGVLQDDDLVDEWGRALTVEVWEQGFQVRSAGPDGRLRTEDDWTLDV